MHSGNQSFLHPPTRSSPSVEQPATADVLGPIRGINPLANAIDHRTTAPGTPKVRVSVCSGKLLGRIGQLLAGFYATPTCVPETLPNRMCPALLTPSLAGLCTE